MHNKTMNIFFGIPRMISEEDVANDVETTLRDYFITSIDEFNESPEVLKEFKERFKVEFTVTQL